jgi:hypothetical protein
MVIKGGAELLCGSRYPAFSELKWNSIVITLLAVLHCTADLVEKFCQLSCCSNFLLLKANYIKTVNRPDLHAYRFTSV